MADNALTELVRNKLQCNICLSSSGKEAVEAICPGNHTFCFECMVRHVCHCMKGKESSYWKELKCPSCRSGSCSVIPSMFMAQIGDVLEAQTQGTSDVDTENIGWLKHFKQSYERLKTNYPSIFGSETENPTITPAQMVVYNRYRKNPLGFILRRHRFSGVHSNRQRYVSVSINERSGDFVVSAHRSRASAMNMVSRSPAQFTHCFICGDASLATDDELARGREESNPRLVVFFQSRPVQLFLSTPHDFNLYFHEIVENSLLRDRILRQIVYVSQMNVNNEQSTSESEPPSWLPI